MAKYVTATISESVNSVLCLNLSDNTTEIKSFSTAKISPEKALKVIKKRFDSEKSIALHVLNSYTVENKYRMTESDFLSYAVELDARPTNERYITRTMDKTTAKTLCINTETNETLNLEFVTTAAKSAAELLAKIKTENPGKLLPLYILETATDSKLYGMTETDFMRFGEIVTD